jgi:EmrB/QacA subfamily drug resistance transporter
VSGENATVTSAVGQQSDRSRWIALVVLCVGMLMIVLDVTVVNVALPSIQSDLGFAQSSLAWVVNAYLISFGGLLLLAGRLGDLLGRRRVFMSGLTLFTDSQGVLVAARFVQGIGGAMTSAVILGMIVTMFPQPGEQAKALGVYAFVASAGGSIGLLAGGVLTQAISWHWIFFINVPIGAVTGALAMRVLPADRGLGIGAGADALGALLITGALMLGVYTIVKPAADDGWGATTTLVLGTVAVALLVAFLIREATVRTPLVPLSILRSRNIAGANAIQALLVAGMFSVFFLGTLYLREVLGYDALEIGFAFLPTTLVMGTLSLRYSERLMMRFGPRTTLIPGLVLIAAGLGLYARVPVHGHYLTDVLPAGLLMGTGVGVSMAALMTLAMSGVEPHQAGLASGLVNTTAQVGGALGLAVLATLSTTRTGSALASGASPHAALTAGYHLGFVVGALLVVAAIAIAGVGLERAPKRIARSIDATPAYSEY